MNERPRCCGDAGGRRSNGEPCASTLGLSAAGLCLSHDPARAAEARDIRVKGGRAAGIANRAARATRMTGMPAPLKTIRDCVAWASWAATATATGDLDIRKAREIGLMIREFRSSFQLSELERTVRRLQAELDAERKRHAPRLG